MTMFDGLQRSFGALFLWLSGKERRMADRPASMPARGEPKWLRLARDDLGIHEIKGPAANPAIMRAWEHVDYDPPNGDETAWCSAKGCEWMEDAGIPSPRAPNARAWLKWGHELDRPRLGCIVVFWRDSPKGWQGHVALYLGPGDRPGTIKCIGGNQSDSVSVREFETARVLGYRWPTTGGNSRTFRAQATGAIGDGMTGVGLAISQDAVVKSLPDLLAISDTVKLLAPYWGGFIVIGILIGLTSRAVTVWARLSDWKAKGV